MAKRLIGTDANQVPSNADLGSAAFLDSNEILTKRGAELSAIGGYAEALGQSANDVFVYDTSMDSDGGAWRQRCGSKSWYNEELNTHTRGSRREFPSVAIITVMPDSVVIYDADNEDLAMWMVFDVGTNSHFYHYHIGRTLSTKNCCAMLNGKLVVGGSFSSSHTEALCEIDFLEDTTIHYDSSTGKFRRGTSLADRNGVLAEIYITDPTQRLPSLTYVDGVDMKVLPDAPVDPNTGLPKPTIAVAGNGGVHVIRHDNKIIDITSSSGSNYTPSSFVKFTPNNKLVFEQDSSSRKVNYVDIPSQDETTSANDGAFDTAVFLPGSPRYTKSATELNIGGPRFMAPYSTVAAKDVEIGKDETHYFNNTTGLSVGVPNPSKPQAGMMAYITSDKNTGFMPGTSLLSTLNTTRYVLPRNLLVNPSFDTNSDWQLGNGWSITGGNAVHNGVATSGMLQNGHEVVVGRQYVLEVTVTAITGTLRLESYSGGGNYGSTSSEYSDFTTTGTHRIVYYATRDGNSQTGVYVFQGGSVTISQMALYEAQPDSSTDVLGLHTVGLPQAHQVAAGAEMLSYGGNFDNNNYFEQIYNPALRQGTNDVTIAFWHKPKPGGSNYRTIFHVYYPGQTSGYGWGVRTGPSTTTYQFWQGNSVKVGGAGGSTRDWNHIVITRSGGSTNKENTVYINGEYVASSVSGATLDFTGQGILRIGDATTKSTSLSLGTLEGDVSMLRISDNASSPEQIRKMYSMEKHIFKPNAKCTLYGGHDDVLRIAYDKGTDELHATTSSGRSVFEGLVRTDNTERESSGAISAINGLVAEE